MPTYDVVLEYEKDFDDDDYKEKVKAHLTDAEAYDNGTASEQAAKIIAKYCL